MKGGGDKQAASRSPVQLESQRFRLLPVAVAGCFLFFLVFLLSSGEDATVFDTRPAVALERKEVGREAERNEPEGDSDAGGGGGATSDSDGRAARPGRDFQADILPRQGENHGHLQQSAEQRSGQKVQGTERAAERNDVAGEAEPKEPEHDGGGGGGGATSDSDEQAAAAAGAAEAVRYNAANVTAAASTAQGAVETTSPPQRRRDNPGKNQQVGGQIELQDEQYRHHDMTTHADPVAQQQPRPPLCDLSDARTDVCDFSGDIRMDAKASAFVVVDPSGGANATSYKVRPYARKGDATCMGRVTEVTVRATADAAAAPRCTRTHSAPAVVFSTSGYAGNIFHDFTDVIVPLYATAQRYRGDVQLVVADAAPRWLAKYDALLRELSRHAPLDLAAAGAAAEVHCFPHAVVGLRAHREFIIEPERSPEGLAMPDFGRFLRRALSLPRDAPTRPGGGGDGGAGRRKPRLLIISRRGTRRLLNIDAVARAAEEAGFEAAVSELDVASDVAQVGRLMNAYDAVVGVHGAGLTNMVFLPPGATVVQIVPWGGLRWIARLDFGEPAEAMGLRYIQYEVAVDESTLKDKYPRDSEIFTNPTALHKKGFAFMRHTFLNGQDIIVDVDRFRAVLLQAFKNLEQ